jgi:cell division protein FtsB
VKKQIQQYLDELAVLKAENNQLKQKIEMLETKVCSVEKRCACFRNNQKLCEDTNENR